MSEMVGGFADVRIIAGTAKGIRLKTPKGMNTRPTADRVKESVFGILAADVVDAEVLDLFAGTGNLGLEALSRGAASATLVDKNIQSVKIMMENAILTDLSRAAVICREEVLAALRRLQAAGKSFDLIFCDPPYNLGLAPKVVDQVFDLILSLRDQGITILLVEQNAERALEIADQGYVLQSGEMVLSGTGRELAESDLIRQAYLAG